MRTLAIRLYHSLRTEKRPLWLRVLQLLITLCVLVFVFRRLQAEDWRNWMTQLPRDPLRRMAILATLLLLPLNLGLETRKWQCLLQSYYPDLPFKTLFRAMLTGMATGIFTPNRIGEYAGRVMSLPEGFRLEAGTHTLVNRLLQLLATLLAGSLGWTYLWWGFQAEMEALFFLHPWSGNALTLGLWLVDLLVLGLLLHPRLWLRWLRLDRWQLPFLQRMDEALCHLRYAQLWQALGLAVLRYLTFSLQYWLLLTAFGYESSVLLAAALIGLTFLLKSLLPSIALSELGVRESVALWIMGGFAFTAFTIVSSTFLLYLCNVILPSLVGLIFVYRIRA